MIDSKKYLLKIRMTDVQLSSNVNELGRIKDKLFKITPTLKDVSSFSSDVSSKTEACIAELEACVDRLNKRTDAFVMQKEEALRYLGMLDNPQYYNVLYKRYFEYNKTDYKYKTLQEIGEEMGSKSKQNIDKLHGKALQELDDIMKVKVDKG